MKNYFLVLLGLAMILMSSTVSTAQEPTQAGSLSVENLLKIVVDFQTIINKPAPNSEDFHRLYKGEAEGERTMLVKQRYCSEVLNLEYDTPPCSAALKQLYENNHSNLYLLNIKNLISDNSPAAIKVFVDPDIKSCKDYSAQNPFVLLKAVALIGSNKFKSIALLLPCDPQIAVYSRLEDVQIRGKSVSDYPLAIPKPPQKSK